MKEFKCRNGCEKKFTALPMNDGVSMKIIQCQSNFSSVHDCHVFSEIIADGQQAFHITTNQVLHHLQVSQ